MWKGYMCTTLLNTIKVDGSIIQSSFSTMLQMEYNGCTL